jgi:hypothetical protein
MSEDRNRIAKLGYDHLCLRVETGYPNKAKVTYV